MRNAALRCKNSLGFYVTNSEQNFIRGAETINNKILQQAENLKKQKAQELKQHWSEKKVHQGNARES